MSTRFGRRAALAMAGAGLVAGPRAARAQAWPTRPVTVILPFSAGGGTDLLARALAQHLGETLGQNFVVDNRSGAGGNVGAALVARATPDGHTLLFGTPGPLANNKLIYRNLPFDPERSFEPVVLIARSPLVVASRTSLPVRSIADLASHARANPGRLTVGVPGNGTLGHITALLLEKDLGISLTSVPYRGTAQVASDLAGGQIDLAMDFLPSYVPLAQEGKVRALAVTTAERSGDLADVPTVQEAGVRGFEASAWYALAAPAGTPAPVVERLNAATNAFLATPRGRDAMAKLSMQAAGGTPADLRAFILAELEKWGPIVKAANITVE